jgi:hypothetical protein
LGPSYEFAFLFLTCTLAPSVSKWLEAMVQTTKWKNRTNS